MPGDLFVNLWETDQNALGPGAYLFKDVFKFSSYRVLQRILVSYGPKLKLPWIHSESASVAKKTVSYN